MSSWADLDLWGFDTETTSLDILGEARIATAALIRIRPNGDVLERSWVINPGVPMSPKASEINGLTDEYLIEHGADPATTIPQIGAALRWVLDQHLPLVVQNAPFDLTLLSVELNRHGLDPIAAVDLAGVIDPIVLVKYDDKVLAKPKRFKDPKTGKGYVYKLPALCERFGVEFIESHEASADAIGAARLARAFAKKQPLIGEMPPGPLFTLQRTACREQKNSLRAYFDKVGTAHDGVDPGWPLHTSLQGQQVSA